MGLNIDIFAINVTVYLLVIRGVIAIHISHINYFLTIYLISVFGYNY